MGRPWQFAARSDTIRVAAPGQRRRREGGTQVSAGSGRANLILAGFMGTGKTSVGQIIARHWGSRFVDFDAELEARFGRLVAEIFATEGEAAFRAAEAALCRALPPGAGWVVATGGGA